MDERLFSEVNPIPRFPDINCKYRYIILFRCRTLECWCRYIIIVIEIDSSVNAAYIVLFHRNIFENNDTLYIIMYYDVIIYFKLFIIPKD